MGNSNSSKFSRIFSALLALGLLSGGTQSRLQAQAPTVHIQDTPTRIEPGDVLWIDVFNAAPEASHTLQPGDMLHVVVQGTLPDQPIDGSYLVQPNGVLSLGPTYGALVLTGNTASQAREAIAEHLRTTLTNPQVSAEVVFTPMRTAAEFTQLQEEYSGEHEVDANGQISLGEYGTLQLRGFTTEQAAVALEQHTTQVRLDVVIRTQRGESCTILLEDADPTARTHRVELRDGDTTRSVLARIAALETFRGKAFWITPPTQLRPGLARICTIEAHAITANGATGMNQRIFAGDTIHIAEEAPKSIEDRIAEIMRRQNGSTTPPQQLPQILQRFPRGHQNNQF